MHEPDDFGLSPFQTLAHVGDPTPAPGHGPFWNKFTDDVWKREPRLREATRDECLAAGAGGVTHVYESAGVRIGCRLVLPEGAGAPAWGVVLLHPYEADEDLDDSVPAGFGGATLKVRLRGYPGSRMDAGDLCGAPGGWIAQGIDSPLGWSLRGGVADAINAVRALRTLLGPESAVSLRGESLGGGVAVIAAAQLGGRERLARLVIGVPSLGDWPWRHARSASAAGTAMWGDAVRVLTERPELASQTRELLRICDAVVHAPRVACPTLCKLASRDALVPAPTAAAVYNALGSSPGRKWRFVVRCGHADCGRDDVRRHALFERLAGEFTDPSHDPAALMRSRSDTLRPDPAPARG